MRQLENQVAEIHGLAAEILLLFGNGKVGRQADASVHFLGQAFAGRATRGKVEVAVYAEALDDDVEGKGIVPQSPAFLEEFLGYGYDGFAFGVGDADEGELDAMEALQVIDRLPLVDLHAGFLLGGLGDELTDQEGDDSQVDQLDPPTFLKVHWKRVRKAATRFRMRSPPSR